ncbi:hypothetical protein AY600_08525 [Phormidium willei BDU 130791]|nr:hypothetical protein AY600_08525 [Phormidium willei BDU 130791]
MAAGPGARPAESGAPDGISTRFRSRHPFGTFHAMTPLLAQLSLLAAAAALLVAAGSDARRYLIPDSCSLVLLAGFALYALGGATQGAWPLHLATATLVFLLGIGLFAAGLAGGGDVKLFAATSIWAGLDLLAVLTLVMALAGGLLVVVVAGRVWLLRRLAAAGQGVGAGASTSVPARTPLTRLPLPYGVAIAAGGLFVLAQRAGLLA